MHHGHVEDPIERLRCRMQHGGSQPWQHVDIYGTSSDADEGRSCPGSGPTWHCAHERSVFARRLAVRWPARAGPQRRAEQPAKHIWAVPMGVAPGVQRGSRAFRTMLRTHRKRQWRRESWCVCHCRNRKATRVIDLFSSCEFVVVQILVGVREGSARQMLAMPCMLRRPAMSCPLVAYSVPHRVFLTVIGPAALVIFLRRLVPNKPLPAGRQDTASVQPSGPTAARGKG